MLELKNRRHKQWGIFWWSGLLVARMRERGIASAQEVAEKFPRQR